MYTYLYDASGTPAGFIRGAFIHDMTGAPIGQLHGTHVYRLNGRYVGELYRDMVVDKYLGRLKEIGTPRDPGNPGMPTVPRGRGVITIPFRDVFAELHER